MNNQAFKTENKLGSVETTLLEWSVKDVTVITDAGEQTVTLDCSVTRKDSKNALNILISPTILLRTVPTVLPSGEEIDDIVSGFYTSAPIVNKQELNKMIVGMLHNMRNVHEVVMPAN